MTGCAHDVATPSEAVRDSESARYGGRRSLVAELPATAAERARRAIEAAVLRTRDRAFEDEILRLEREQPEVGGVYYEDEGRALVVSLTDLSAEKRLRGVLARQAAQWRVPPAMRQVALATLRVVPARYAFSTLVAWQEMLIDDAAARGLWWGLDADEKANRVHVKVSSDAAIARLGAAATRLGIPLEALLIRVEPTPSDYGSLRETYRPAFGGLELRNQEWGNLCTLGWNVTNASTAEEGFLTAGHCVQSPGVLDERFAQVLHNTLGTVRLNPPWQDGALGYGGDDSCRGREPCTHADVIWVRHSTPSNSRHTVAKTAYAGVGDGQGSISIVGTFYPSPALYTVVTGGPRANKVGRLTGWTSGDITETCLFFDFPPKTVPCTHRAAMRIGQTPFGV